jgi:hypothetical protein
MNKLLASMSILCFCTALFAEKLPLAWTGTWSGPCLSDNTMGLAPEHGMTLTIKPIAETPHFDFHIQYTGEPVRRYELQLVNEKEGHYIVDEKNGIILDDFYKQGSLNSMFLINGRIFQSQWTLNGGVMNVRQTAYDGVNSRNSGGANSIPAVLSFNILISEKCELKKVN